MTVFLRLLPKLIVAAAISFAIWMAYSWSYDRGYNTAQQEHTAQIVEKISEIEGYSRTNLEQTLVASQQASKDLNLILSKVKSSGTTIIKNGDCVPSPDYISAYNAMIERANK